MKIVVAIIILLCAFVFLWPILMKAGQQGLKYFGKIDPFTIEENKKDEEDT